MRREVPMSRNARPVLLSSTEHRILTELSRSRVRAQHLVERVTMVVLSAMGVSDAEQARRLGVDEQRPRRWRGRWLAGVAGLDEAERADATEHELRERIEVLLADARRVWVRRRSSRRRRLRSSSRLLASPRATVGCRLRTGPRTSWRKRRGPRERTSTS
jgi:hypothetical protein